MLGTRSHRIHEWQRDIFRIVKSSRSTVTRLLSYCFCFFASLLWLNAATWGDDETNPTDGLNFFESKIRPVLIEHCYDCHSSETELSGGLGLDHRDGLLKGGDLGPAIHPGDHSASLLWQAISYENPHLQMPPDGKLDEAILQDIGRWIDQGAPDPRHASHDPSSNPSQPDQSGGGVESDALPGSDHWSFQKRTPVDRLTAELQAAGLESPYGRAIDYWVDRTLQQRELQAAGPAEPAVLARRLYFDLTGLPPSPEELREFLQDPAPDRLERLVESLLASPRFGEARARHWMDVVRYADSITLRGFVLPEAWRYRDYLIEAFNQDRSFQEMIREQIAGDLLNADDPDLRARQVVATTFLALGNTNLEQQDKTQLELDYLDEQLDVIGSALLGMTLGCARCHDHKFDPIPTSEYYALAGILRSASGLRHANVSEWLEAPLPLPPDQEEYYQQLAAKQDELQKQVSKLKQQLEGTSHDGRRHISVSDLPGIVIDNSQAMLVGHWNSSQHTHPIVGQDYLHDGNDQKGKKSATYEPSFIPPGEYEVRLSYQHGGNRASNVMVKVFSADGEHEIMVNQRVKPPDDGLWFSLGTYRFEADGQAIVLIGNTNTDGHVIADAVQFLPLDSASSQSGAESDKSKSDAVAKESDRQRLEKERAVREQLADLERELKAISGKLQEKPKYLAIQESHDSSGMQIRIRGNAHQLGQEVPRGFLTAFGVDLADGTDDEVDRLALAQWIAHAQNPLTARVYVNRIWLQLMGRGIVDTPNNFGTTGTDPSHPELLDWLAERFIESCWSTKTLIREIVSSKAYQRSSDAAYNQPALTADPENKFYWRGQIRRIPVEGLRDAMLMVSGELDLTMGGSAIRSGTKTDYDYQHDSLRRSVYQPAFRNSLPPLFDAFDFANPSVSVGKRPRTTGALQGLTLMNDPWVQDRSRATAARVAVRMEEIGLENAVEELYRACFARQPSTAELEIACDLLETGSTEERLAALEQWIWSLFASIDFRYLD